MVSADDFLNVGSQVVNKANNCLQFRAKEETENSEGWGRMAGFSKVARPHGEGDIGAKMGRRSEMGHVEEHVQEHRSQKEYQGPELLGGGERAGRSVWLTRSAHSPSLFLMTT